MFKGYRIIDIDADTRHTIIIDSDFEETLIYKLSVYTDDSGERQVVWKRINNDNSFVKAYERRGLNVAANIVLSIKYAMRVFGFSMEEILDTFWKSPGALSYKDDILKLLTLI